MRRCQCIQVALICGFSVCVLVRAQDKSNSPVTSAFRHGVEYERSGNLLAALRSFNQAMQLDPENREVCDHLSAAAKGIQADFKRWSIAAREETQVILEKARANYGQKYSLHPEKAFYQWALGECDDSISQEDAERHFRIALTLDSKYVPASLALASTLALRGDATGARSELRRAFALAPRDPDVLAAYSESLDSSELVLRRKLIDSLLELSPRHPAGAELLSRLAVDEGDLNVRIADLERVKLLYPPDATNNTEWYMRFLFDAYNRTDPVKALSLAHEMAKTAPSANVQHDWLVFANYAQTMVQARSLVDRKSYAEALKLLKEAECPYPVSPDPQTLLQAEASDLAGHTAQAYQILIGAMALQPTDALSSGIVRYAEKLKIAPTQVLGDFLSIQRKNSRSIGDSILMSYRDAKQIKISDFRGDVVLVRYWDASSKDCRDQFRVLQELSNKYAELGLKVITIHIQPLQDTLAGAILTHYSLLPLRIQEWTAPYYEKMAVPTNILIDRSGRAIFYPTFWGFDPRRSFELEVQSLLSQKK